MSFKGSDFLVVAQSLMQRASDEAYARSAVNRAYYAAFHTAQDYCLEMGIMISKSNTHTETRRSLENLGQSAVAARLRILHDWRKNADYDVRLPVPNPLHSTTIAIDLAERIVEQLSLRDS